MAPDPPEKVAEMEERFRGMKEDGSVVTEEEWEEEHVLGKREAEGLWGCLRQVEVYFRERAAEGGEGRRRVGGYSEVETGVTGWDERVGGGGEESEGEDGREAEGSSDEDSDGADDPNDTDDSEDADDSDDPDDSIYTDNSNVADDSNVETAHEASPPKAEETHPDDDNSTDFSGGDSNYEPSSCEAPEEKTDPVSEEVWEKSRGEMENEEIKVSPWDPFWVNLKSGYQQTVAEDYELQEIIPEVPDEEGVTGEKINRSELEYEGKGPYKAPNQELQITEPWDLPNATPWGPFVVDLKLKKVQLVGGGLCLARSV